MQVFIKETLGNIFSGKISYRYTTIKNKSNFNKERIEIIKKWSGELKQILDIEFIDCFNHYMGIGEPLKLLFDMKTFKDIKINDEIEKAYFIEISQNYKEKIEKKRPRHTKKKKGKIK